MTNVELWSVDLPLPKPVLTVIGTIEEMAVLAVRVSDPAGPSGPSGCGYASFPTRRQRDDTVALAGVLLAVPAIRADLRTAESADALTGGERPLEEALAAASALSIAGWDLSARRRGGSAAEEWAPAPARPPSYGSGMFLGCSEAQLLAEAEAFKSAGFRAVKMRVGGDPDDDAERVAVVEAVFDEPLTVAVDAYESWSSAQANRFLGRLRRPLLWFEDPTPSDELAHVVRGPTPLAGGERCRTADEVRHLTEALGPGGVLVLDVQNLGGPTRFLESARVARAAGGMVSAHVFPTISVHLLAATVPTGLVEVLDWWDLLFDGNVAPDDAGRVHPRGPGFGVQLDDDALARWGRRWAP